MSITDIYRKISKILHSFGADQVFLLHSKTSQRNGTHVLFVEIVVDRLTDFSGAKKALQGISRDLECRLYDGSLEENFDLLSEGETDGIQL